LNCVAIDESGWGSGASRKLLEFGEGVGLSVAPALKALDFGFCGAALASEFVFVVHYFICGRVIVLGVRRRSIYTTAGFFGFSPFAIKVHQSVLFFVRSARGGNILAAFHGSVETSFFFHLSLGAVKRCRVNGVEGGLVLLFR